MCTWTFYVVVAGVETITPGSKCGLEFDFCLFFCPFVNYYFQHSQSSRKRCKDTANATPEGCFSTYSLFVSILYILLFAMIIFFFYVWYCLPLNPFQWLYQLTLVTCQLPQNRLILRQKRKKKKKVKLVCCFRNFEMPYLCPTVEMMIMYR